MILRALVIGALLAASPCALAHQAGISHSALERHGGRAELTLRLSTADLAALWPGLATPERLRGGVPAELARALVATVHVSQGPIGCSIGEVAARLDPPDGASFSAAFRCPDPVEAVQVRLGFLARLPPGHVHVARVVGASSVEERVLDARHDELAMEASSSSWQRAPRLVALGMEHIFTGWDHVAFLLGLLLVGGRLRDVLRVVTSFTAGHALTLALATLGGVAPPAGVVEPLIAATIVYVAVENVLAQRRGAAPSGRWAIALGFGLVHGFGFAGALAELGLPRAHLASALFSFNIGVELGQAAIVALAFPTLLLLRRKPAFVSTGIPAASTALGCAGLVWLVQRLGA